MPSSIHRRQRALASIPSPPFEGESWDAHGERYQRRTSQVRSQIRCIRILRDHERPLYDPPSLPLDSQIDSKGYALAVFIEHVAG
jgi:hypothetical protein